MTKLIAKGKDCLDKCCCSLQFFLCVAHSHYLISELYIINSSIKLCTINILLRLSSCTSENQIQKIVCGGFIFINWLSRTCCTLTVLDWTRIYTVIFHFLFFNFFGSDLKKKSGLHLPALGNYLGLKSLAMPLGSSPRPQIFWHNEQTQVVFVELILPFPGDRNWE